MTCSCDAEKAVETRQRLILKIPSTNGTKCPVNLMEERDCAPKCNQPNFVLGNWGVCHVVNGYYPDETCVGVKYRSAKCVLKTEIENIELPTTKCTKQTLPLTISYG
jgi:hypothetical protein